MSCCRFLKCWFCLAILIMGLSFHGTASAVLSRNQLIEDMKVLKPLQKAHYSWKLEAGSLFEPGYEDLLYQYARLTHALSVSAEAATQEMIEKCVYNCARVNKLEPEIPASIGVNYSPYHRKFGEDLPPTNRGPTYKAELKYFEKRLLFVKETAADYNRKYLSNVKIGAVLLDCERFHVKPGHDDWNQAIADALDAVHEVASRVFPDARIEWYGRGIQRVFTGDGWAKKPYFTGTEIKSPLSCSLYTVPELERTRETFRRTVQLAEKLEIEQVTPWVALASGYRRSVDSSQKFVIDWDYDLIYSFQLGAELNHPWFAERPKRYAPYSHAKIIVFYPAPFYSKTPHWGKHFLAYVRGANRFAKLSDLGYSLED